MTMENISEAVHAAYKKGRTLLRLIRVGNTTIDNREAAANRAKIKEFLDQSYKNRMGEMETVRDQAANDPEFLYRSGENDVARGLALAAKGEKKKMVALAALSD